MESVVRLQDRLVVGVSREEGADGTRISFTYTDKSPRTAAGWVNALANSFADGYRQEWRVRAEQAYRDAEEAAGRAAEELREATSRLNAAGGPRLQESHRAAAKPAAASADASLVDNPAWLDLQRQLADLRQRRARLLVNRTPIHPEVQQTEIRIADLQRQLEATERFVPAAARTTASLPASNAQHAAPQAEAAESLNRLAKAAQRASRASRDAAQARRQAEITRRQDLQIDLEFAQAEPFSSSPAAHLRMVAAAIVAGLTTTIGFGMIAVGAAIEPTVNSLADVRAWATVPIVGVIPRSRRSGEKRLAPAGLLRRSGSAPA